MVAEHEDRASEDHFNVFDQLADEIWRLMAPARTVPQKPFYEAVREIMDMPEDQIRATGRTRIQLVREAIRRHGIPEG